MLTKADFQKAISESVAKYPQISELVQARDPRILQSLDAIATMLSMLSSQIEVSMMETFQKTRETTIMADAAMRGIIPTSVPAKAVFSVHNKSQIPLELESGRYIIDSSGTSFRVDSTHSIAPGQLVPIRCTQIVIEEIVHEVTQSVPFYPIEIPSSKDGSSLCGIEVIDAINSVPYVYKKEYINVLPDEKVFNVEADEKKKIYVRFGLEGVIGYQPQPGDIFRLVIKRSFGDISFKFNSPASLERLINAEESMLEIKAQSLEVKGQDPLSLALLAEIARFPALYDDNAVFLGEFKLLVIKSFPNLKFVNVWNEAYEEIVRGEDIRNVNTLFVACVSDLSDEIVVTDPKKVRRLSERDDELTPTQVAIKNKILSADDSYRVVFYTPLVIQIKIEIVATVPSSFSALDVKQQIRATLLQEYGEGSLTSRRGGGVPLYQRIYEVLRDRVPALSVAGTDIKVNIVDAHDIGVASNAPEVWRFLTENTLSVSVVNQSIVHGFGA